MTLHTLAGGIIAVLLGASPAPWLPPLPADVPPRGSARGTFTVAVVDSVDKSAAEINYTYINHRQVVETVKDGPGAGTRTVHYVESITAQCSLAAFALYDAKGTRLAAETFMRRVRKGSMILFCQDDILPAPEYLRVFRDDALILLKLAPLGPIVPRNDARPPSVAPNPR